MRRLILIILLFVWCFSTSIFNNRVKHQSGFGIRIALQANGEVLTYIGYLTTSNERTIKQNLSREQFIKYSSGYWPSQFNPDRTNYFSSFSINCGCRKDSLFKSEYIFCDALDSLWKIRFSQYPYIGISEEGWSHTPYRPSLKQQRFLYDTYQLNNIDSDYFLDSNLWILLKDVQDEQWIEKYKSLW